MKGMKSGPPQPKTINRPHEAKVKSQIDTQIMKQCADQTAGKK